ncbi:hypothetical protein FDP41_011997 [Naegleria fowleri]|uniref:non-specific serine/threonine protein kinase n=1 Tax=Naegleria fowleri TaxID=5763 RepID=A0A6A5C335_NAEFO|nr:uncharacterized protein FDP41_011997 [Naegleria fowleri]KAF0982136.1 hypothetical protein FDP41_011997 [Naegleria fowleri]
MVKIVANYEIMRTLGQGKYSKVKFGRDLETGETYAIKIMNLNYIKKEQMETQLKREIAIMKIMKHPNIVKLKEVLQTENNMYVIMELVTGGELFDRIVAAEKFDEITARRYFHQLVSAVEYCHNQGIAHRDLKPENLLLDSTDRLKITDFGLSSIVPNKLGKSQLLKTTCGTPNYVSPEVIKEKGYDGFISDIWSLGVILYVMLTGRLPFDDRNINVLFKKIESGKVDYPIHLSKEAKHLISHMLQVNPKKRYTIAQIKASKWFQIGYKEEYSVIMPQPQPKIELSNSDIKNAVKDSFYKEVDQLPQNSTQKSPPEVRMNAFDLASQFVMGSISKMATGQDALLIRRQTRLVALGQIEEISEKVFQILKNERANPKFKGTNLIKCYMNMADTVITMNVAILKTVSDSLLIIEFRRGKGNFLAFHQFFRHVASKMSDFVVSANSQPKTEPQTQQQASSSSPQGSAVDPQKQ